MFCPKCGKINPDNQEKCSGCNALLHEENAVSAPKKGGKALKIVLTLIAVLIVVGIVILFLNGCVNKIPKNQVTF